MSALGRRNVFSWMSMSFVSLQVRKSPNLIRFLTIDPDVLPVWSQRRRGFPCPSEWPSHKRLLLSSSHLPIHGATSGLKQEFNDPIIDWSVNSISQIVLRARSQSSVCLKMAEFETMILQSEPPHTLPHVRLLCKCHLIIALVFSPLIVNSDSCGVCLRQSTGWC